MRILVVDDSEAMLLSLTCLLEFAGHEVRSCSKGQEVLQQAGIFKPELILLDLGLPDLNGIDVCRSLRRTSEHRNIRIIAQTGYDDAQTRADIQAAGFDDHLVKPVHPEQLLALLSEPATNQ